MRSWLRESSIHLSWTFLAFSIFTRDQRELGRIYFYGSFLLSGLELFLHFLMSSLMLHGETESCLCSQGGFEFYQMLCRWNRECFMSHLFFPEEMAQVSIFSTGFDDSCMIFLHLFSSTAHSTMAGLGFPWFMTLCVYRFLIHHHNLSMSNCG